MGLSGGRGALCNAKAICPINSEVKSDEERRSQGSDTG